MIDMAAAQGVIIGPLEPPNLYPASLQLATRLDCLWMSNYFMFIEWFQSVVHRGHYNISCIEIVPFLNQDPNQPTTIYSVLVFVQQLTGNYQLGVLPVTVHQPICIKAAEIVDASPNLNNITVRLGRFNLVMSYMGVIGHIMTGSGLIN